jgi:hypothetical protein
MQLDQEVSLEIGCGGNKIIKKNNSIKQASILPESSPASAHDFALANKLGTELGTVQC